MKSESNQVDRVKLSQSINQSTHQSTSLPINQASKTAQQVKALVTSPIKPESNHWNPQGRQNRLLKVNL